jgi:hypothetical protein
MPSIVVGSSPLLTYFPPIRIPTLDADDCPPMVLNAFDGDRIHDIVGFIFYYLSLSTFLKKNTVHPSFFLVLIMLL